MRAHLQTVKLISTSLGQEHSFVQRCGGNLFEQVCTSAELT
jgi:hypothetical protein